MVGGATFVYREESDAPEHASSTNGHHTLPNSASRRHNTVPLNGRPPFDARAYLEDVISQHSSSSSASVISNMAMENMVDNLVSNENIANGLPSTPKKKKPLLPSPRLSTHGWTYEPPPIPPIDYGPIGTPPRLPSSNQTDLGPIGSPPRNNSGNETSYGVIGTPTAQELARKLSTQGSQQTRHHVESSLGSMPESSDNVGKPGYTTHSPRNQPTL